VCGAVQRGGLARRFSTVKHEAAQVIGGLGEATPADREHAAIAVAALFREHHLELVRLALVMVGDLATAEDVVQDAFERVHRRWHGLRDEGNGLLGYMRAAVLNGCRSVHRRAVVARKHAPSLAEPLAVYPDTAAQAADRGALMAALRALPRRQREVLVLRYYTDLDVDEVARTLRIGPSAVRSTATRGLASLARIIRED
jgi:RNA polymerase sigma-70 factor (sigma-E family)